jgi:predicted nucleic acid-binding protein
VILLDTSGLLAAIDASQRQHATARRALESAAPPWCLSPFVLAELDYLLATRVGQEAERALLAEVGRGVYRLETFDAADIEAAERLIGRYRDLEIGLADASLVVLANRYGVRDLLTLDERHFRTLRAAGGRPFRLLPADLE